MLLNAKTQEMRDLTEPSLSIFPEKFLCTNSFSLVFTMEDAICQLQDLVHGHDTFLFIHEKLIFYFI